MASLCRWMYHDRRSTETEDKREAKPNKNEPKSQWRAKAKNQGIIVVIEKSRWAKRMNILWVSKQAISNFRDFRFSNAQNPK